MKTNGKKQRTIIFWAVLMLITAASLVVMSAGCENKIMDIIARDLAAGQPPMSPSKLHAQPMSVSRIDLSWSDNSDNETDFQIQRRIVSSEDWQTESVGQDSTTYSDKELEPESEYIYRMRAVNVDGESAWTEEVSATTLAPPTYTVTYDGNGHDSGIVPVDDNKYTVGSTVTTIGNSGNLTKIAYAFAGWNTEPDGSGTSYSAGSTFDIGANNITLYAEWSQNVHTITFDKVDPAAIGSMADQNIPEEAEAQLAICGFALTGWTFIGWSTEQYGSVEYLDGANYKMGDSDVTLYAQWSQNTHTLSFDKSDPAATGSMPDLNIDEGDIISLPPCGFSKVDWLFAGWSTSPGGDIQYLDGADYEMGSSDDTLFAKWDPTFTVTYNANGATGGNPPTDANRYAEGDLVNVHGPGTMTKTGCVFISWNTEVDGTGNNVSISFMMGTADVVLHAQWEYNEPPGGPFNLRDPGPAGGYIFYINPNPVEDGWKYLEAAPESSEFSNVQWGYYGNDIPGAESIEIGTGKQNTADIVGWMGPGHIYAAQKCDALTVNDTYDDWFLPSIEEVTQMYLNLAEWDVGGLSDSDLYWTSSEIDANTAYDRCMNQYCFGDPDKRTEKKVRPVRMF